MGLLDWFKGSAEEKTPEKAKLPAAAAPLFYSARAENAHWKEDVRTKIRLPANIRAFTTGLLPLTAEGDVHPDTHVRYEARRARGEDLWKIEKITQFHLAEGTEAPDLDGHTGIEKIGETTCDFDALRFLSEVSAFAGDTPSAAPEKENAQEDIPHWTALAAKALQPIDKKGLVWPVAEGEILGAPSGTLLFSDEQMAIRNATKPPAIAVKGQKVLRENAVSTEFNDLMALVAADKALLAAAEHGDTEAARQALAQGANPDIRYKGDHSVLHAAAFHGYVDIVRLLLDHDANPDILAENGSTPLCWALDDDKEEDIVRLLLDYGADPNAKRRRDSQAVLLHKAVQNRCGAIIVRSLLDYGAKPNVQDENGMTPLYDAAYYGHKEICEILLSHGTDPVLPDNKGMTPLHKAASNGYKDICALFLARNVDPDIRNKADETPLHYAVHHGKEEIVRLLLDYDVDVNAQDKDGDTPLHNAAWKGYTNLCALLISCGAKPDIQTKDGKTPLDLAQKCEKRDAALLLSRAMQVKAPVKNSPSPV